MPAGARGVSAAHRGSHRWQARTADELVHLQLVAGELDARRLVFQHQRVVGRVELCGGDNLGARQVQVLHILVQDARLQPHLLVQRAQQDALNPVGQLKHLALCEHEARLTSGFPWREPRGTGAQVRMRAMRSAAGSALRLPARRAETATAGARREREERTWDARPLLFGLGQQGPGHEREALKVELKVLPIHLVGQAEALVLRAPRAAASASNKIPTLRRAPAGALRPPRAPPRRARTSDVYGAVARSSFGALWPSAAPCNASAGGRLRASAKSVSARRSAAVARRAARSACALRGGALLGRVEHHCVGHDARGKCGRWQEATKPRRCARCTQLLFDGFGVCHGRRERATV